MGSGPGVARAPLTRPLRMRIVVWRSFFKFLDWVTMGQLGASGAVLCDLGDQKGGTGGMKTRTPSNLSSRAIVLGRALVLLLSNVSGSVGVGASVVGAPPTGDLKT